MAARHAPPACCVVKAVYNMSVIPRVCSLAVVMKPLGMYSARCAAHRQALSRVPLFIGGRACASSVLSSLVLIQPLHTKTRSTQVVRRIPGGGSSGDTIIGVNLSRPGLGADCSETKQSFDRFRPVWHAQTAHLALGLRVACEVVASSDW